MLFFFLPTLIINHSTRITCWWQSSNLTEPLFKERQNPNHFFSTRMPQDLIEKSVWFSLCVCPYSKCTTVHAGFHSSELCVCIHVPVECFWSFCTTETRRECNRMYGCSTKAHCFSLELKKNHFAFKSWCVHNIFCAHSTLRVICPNTKNIM